MAAELNRIKEWILTFNLHDQEWRKAVEEATTFDELENLACPLVAEIGWLNLAGLADFMKVWG